MEIFWFILTGLFFGFLCSIPGLLFGYFLDKKGIIRSSPWLIIISTIVWTFGGRILFPDYSFISILLFISIAAPLIYMNELWFTAKWGRWWWLKTDKHKE
ncbi:MAG: hypothetical protein HY867_01700 [Chloroflexi bacterium]|nr:hypothetical protein [Chloroflexota bacterium]